MRNPPAIIPKPVSLETREGAFTLTRDTVVLLSAGDETVRELAGYLVMALERPTGFRLESATEHTAGGKVISLRLEPELAAEAYTLEVTAETVALAGGGFGGLFYAIQTLLQLLPAEVASPFLMTRTAWTIPARFYPG